jgi:hypothetical protein
MKNNTNPGAVPQAEIQALAPVGARMPLALAVECVWNLYHEFKRVKLPQQGATLTLSTQEMADLRMALLSIQAARVTIAQARAREYILVETLRIVDLTIDFSELPGLDADIKAALNPQPRLIVESPDAQP